MPVLTYPGPQGAKFARLMGIWGQSNARGRAPLTELPANLSGARPNVLIWDGSSFTPLQAKTNSNQPATQPGLDWGPEMRLADLAAAHYGETVYVVKYAESGSPLTPLTGSTWNPARRGSLFDGAHAQLKDALRAIRNSGRIPLPVGWLYGQGEADAQLVITQQEYADPLGALFNSIRDAVGRPDLPIADMLVRSKNFTVTTVNGAKAQVAAALGSNLIISDGMGDIGDSVHLDGGAQLAFGRHAWERFVPKSYALPASLPPRAFELSVAQQTDWQLGGVQSISQWTDLSGGGRHFTQAVAGSRPQLIDGNDKGSSVVRALSNTKLTGPTNPVPANSSYTVFYLVENFINPTGTGPRVVLSATNTGFLTAYLSGSDKVVLRNGTTVILTASLGITTAAQHIVALTYRAGAGVASTTRINGEQVAFSTAKANHSGGTLTLFDHLGNAFINADFRRLGLVVGGLTQAQEETLEGGLAHLYGLTELLPASHPFKSIIPT